MGSARQKLFALGLPETEIAVLPDPPPASLRRHELRSPITGRVAERRVDLGALVGCEGQESELYVIADLSEVWADLAVSPAELSNIQEGQVITLFAGASSERAKAKVIFVSPLLGIVETLIQNSDEANLAPFSSGLTTGQSVRILSRPFANFVGQLERLDATWTCSRAARHDGHDDPSGGSSRRDLSCRRVKKPYPPRD